jgi:hypothetical protein
VGYLPEFALLHVWDSLAFSLCLPDVNGSYSLAPKGLSLQASTRKNFVRILVDLLQVSAND